MLKKSWEKSQMTEQKILDKTIEYLNKYSNCFKNWELEIIDNRPISIKATIEWNAGERYDSDEPRMCEQDIHENFPYLVGEHWLSSRDYHWEKFNQDIVFYSEFRIAYNIIKDLAQPGTNSLG